MFEALFSILPMQIRARVEKWIHHYDIDSTARISPGVKIIYNDKKKKLKIGKKCQLTILFKLYHNEQKGKIGG